MAFKQSPFPMVSGTKGHSSALKRTWKEAYEISQKKEGSRYKGMSEEAYIAEAKRQSASYKKTGKWDVKSKETYQPKKEDDKGPDLVEDVASEVTAVETPTAKTKYQIRQEKHKGKRAAMDKGTPGGTEITRAEQADIKVKKLTSKQETAVAEGKTKKAARLAKRVSKRKIKAEKLTAKAEARERGGGVISVADRKAIKTQKLKSKLATVDPESRKGKRIAKRVKKREGEV